MLMRFPTTLVHVMVHYRRSMDKVSAFFFLVQLVGFYQSVVTLDLQPVVLNTGSIRDDPN